MTTTSIGQYDNCVQLESGKFSIAITQDFGPRVIGGSIDGSDNIFAVFPPEAMHESGFCLYGGHRLWHSPEVSPRTYAPDNDPVEVEELEDGGLSITRFEEENRLHKNITIRALGDEQFNVCHTIVNRNQWAIELAPWALSVMAPGGKAIIPQLHEEDANPYAADRRINFWPYAQLNDPRFSLTQDFYILRQNTSAQTPFKLGCSCPLGWIAYVNGSTAFVKKVDYDPNATYPDHGSSIETYSCNRFLEIETVGKLVALQPNEEAVHVEVWQGLSGLGATETDDEIKANLVSRIK